MGLPRTAATMPSIGRCVTTHAGTECARQRVGICWPRSWHPLRIVARRLPVMRQGHTPAQPQAGMLRSTHDAVAEARLHGLGGRRSWSGVGRTGRPAQRAWRLLDTGSSAPRHPLGRACVGPGLKAVPFPPDDLAVGRSDSILDPHRPRPGHLAALSTPGIPGPRCSREGLRVAPKGPSGQF
jgi:hypothetical protein